MSLDLKQLIKKIMGYVPLSVELYSMFRAGKPTGDRYMLYTLPRIMDETMSAAMAASKKTPTGNKHIFIFSTLHFWVEHTTLTGLALASQGHKVTLGYLPYADWNTPLSRFDLRKHIIHSKNILKKIKPLVHPICLLDVNTTSSLTPDLYKAIEEVSLFDSQYTLQAEEIDRSHPIYRLRLERNLRAAKAVLAHFQRHRPDVVIVPNGVILEFGAVFAVAYHLGLETITYEFGEQSNRIWIAKNAQIIRHDTDALWSARKDKLLGDEQREWLETFFAGRQTVQRGDSFARLWQESNRQGEVKTRSILGLDNRPIVLFTTNVLGDSLTLGRQLFSATMSEWITRLVKYMAGHIDIQWVIRIHPGENLTLGPSITGVILSILPKLPEHIHMIGPKEKINTYDLMEIASLGLVYTTTSGLEMATRGIPVITAGRTHYRGRGFTFDANSYDEYFALLDKILADPQSFRLTRSQKDLAWNYSYRFFREFPRPFPWHILHISEDTQKRTMQFVLSEEGLAEYGKTFGYLTGEPIDWKTI
jgi:hypothetical protein